MKAGLTGLAAGTATAVMRGGRISATQIAVDAFGTAIGNALGESVAEFTVVPKAEAVRQRTQEGFRAGEIAYQNEYEGNLIAVLIRGVDFSG